MIKEQSKNLIITSVQNQLIKSLLKLHQSKYRKKEQKFLINGWNLLQVALKENLVNQILLVNKPEVINKFNQLVNNKISFIFVSEQVIEKLSENISPQPVIAVCNFPAHEETLLNNVLVLDQIQDPGNLGAILRSCNAFGINQVFLSENSVDQYNYKVISSSQGALFTTKIVYCNLSKKLVELKQKNYCIYGTVLHQGTITTTISKIKFSEKNVLIFGNEGNGINKKIWPLIDKNYVIPTTGAVESLNLAVSVAISCYLLFINNIIK